MVEITGEDELRAWLEKQPREVSVAIAARIALRNLSFWDTDWARDRKTRAALLLPIFRATVVPWVAAKYPTQCVADLRQAADSAADSADSARTAARPAADSARSAAALTALSALSALFATAAAVISEADFAALSTRSAALSARSARSAVWTQISHDGTFIEEQSRSDGPALARALTSRALWHQGDGKLIANWRRIETILLAADEGWEVWTTWYDRRLRSNIWNEALEVERVISPTIPWTSGDPVKVNRAIAEIEAFHIALRARQPETVAFNPATGLHSFVADQPEDPRSLQDVIDLVTDRIESLRGDAGGNNMFAIMKPIFETLLRCFDKHGSNAQRIHDELYSAHKTVISLLQSGDLAPDAVRLTPFIDSLANGFADVRTNDEKVDKTVRGRVAHRLRAADEEEMLSLSLKTEAASAATDADGGAELAEDLEVLRALRDDGTHPTNKAPEISAHRTASRLPQVDAERSLGKLRDNAVENADRIAKIDAGAKAGFRWLTYLLDILG